MATVLKSLQYFESLQNKIGLAFQKTIKANSEFILNLQRKQLMQGIDIEGRRLKHSQKSYSVYSKGYERKKKKAGKYTGVINLNFDGDYHKGFFVTIKDFDEAVINAPEAIVNGFNLSEGFREWYGNFEGLTDQNKKIAIEYMKSSFFKLLYN